MRPCRTGLYFYSRPCGRGDFTLILNVEKSVFISTHAPAGGATSQRRSRGIRRAGFLLTPLREGRLFRVYRCPYCGNFYSRPCGRGDNIITLSMQTGQSFLLTPLREGRRLHPIHSIPPGGDFYSRPCGRGDKGCADRHTGCHMISTHAPAGGATAWQRQERSRKYDFYSRPCGRGDLCPQQLIGQSIISTHAPAGGATNDCDLLARRCRISTHAPAGGATAIFHKSVMRFCGKLPKDDTVLCLASFGFPGRDPKAVYLA